MHPVLLDLGAVKVYSYGAFVLLALGVGLGAFALMVARLRLRPVPMVVLGAGLPPLLLFGAKAGDVVLRFRDYLGQPLGALLRGGLALTPALICGAVAVLIVALVARESIGGTFDAVVAAMLPALAVGRVGCLLAGCCFGLPTTLPWAVHYPPGGLIPREMQGLGLHPSPLYLAGTWALLFLLMWRRADKRRFPGELALLGVAVYSAVSVLEPWFRWARDPERLWILVAWGLVGVAALAALIVNSLAVRARPNESVAP